MNPTARILLLFGALFLLVFGIVCLKKRLGHEPLPPAFVPPGSSESTMDYHGRHRDQPTILSAESGGENDFPIQTQLHEVEPIPLNGSNEPQADIPINVTSPELRREPAVRPLEEQPAPSSNEVGADYQGAAVLQPPIAVVSFPDEAAGIPSPTSIVTIENDSWWSISERVYGRGDFYKPLFLLNRALAPRPDRIVAGIEVSTPSIAELQRRFPDIRQ